MIALLPALRRPTRTATLALVATLWGAATPSRASAAELGIRRDGPAVQLTLRGEDGKEYSLEAIEALLNEEARRSTPPAWREVARIAPTNRPVALFDPTCSTRPQNFYRLRLLQGSVPVNVPNFRLIDLNGDAQELFYHWNDRAVVVVLAGPDLTSLEPVADQLRSLGRPGVPVWVVAIGSELDRPKWRAQQAELGLETAVKVLTDEGGAVTRQLTTGAFPEGLILNPGRWAVVYQGRLADAVTTANGPVVHPLLSEALEQHLRGDRVAIRLAAVEPSTLPPVGPVSYERDIAPLLQKHCVQCHSPGNIAPWAMTDYRAVQELAPLIKDEVLTRRMPPWHADRAPQNYSNDEMLTPGDLARLVEWIDRDAPRGDGPDPLAENVPPPPPDWPLGPPDQVITLETQTIEATGTIPYRYVVAMSPFSEDVWLRAAVLKPGNRQVVHHALAFTALTLADLRELKAGLGGYFAAYVPGMEQVEFPAGTGKRLKKGSALIFQMHYTSNGEAATDTTQLGLYLSPTPPARELRTAAAYNIQFTIPPGAENHPARAEFVLPRDGTVYEFSPHMHYRGRWFRFEAEYPDRRRETLLNVPFYRFDWQTLYRLATPKTLPAGTKIIATGAWDNSNRNPYNPDPTAAVQFGEQSWEEMFIGYFNWSDAR